MLGHNKDEKNGAAGGFVAESVVASEDDVVIDLVPERKAVDKRKVAMIVAGILVVIGVGAGVWWWRSRVPENETETLSEEEKALAEKAKAQYAEEVLEFTGVSVERTEEMHEEVNKFLYLAYNKEISVDEAISRFQELIDRTNSDAEKAKYYNMRSVMLENIDAGEKADEVKTKMLADAYEADRLFPTVESARRIVSLEEQLGNEKAKEEYEGVVKSRQSERSRSE